MEIFITGDSNIESGVNEVVLDLCGKTKSHFISRDYGKSLAGIAAVLMCRDPDLEFRRRVRFSKKEKILYMDVMLDLSQMTMLDHPARVEVVCSTLLEEVPATLGKYDFEDFDAVQFRDDLTEWLTKQSKN